MRSYERCSNSIENNEQVKYPVTLDTRRVSAKPGTKYQSTITSHLTTYTGLTITEFAEYVSPPHSYTWSGGKFNGLRSHNNWLEQQVFALDFDDGSITIEEVITETKQLGFTPQLWYSTFSDSSELRKFRVVYFLDSVVKEKLEHEFIYKSLFTLFPQVDKRCKDASRYFLGGKNYTIIDNSPIPKSKFLDSLAIQMYTVDSNKFRKVPLKSEYFSNINSVQNCTYLYNYNRNIQFQTENQNQKTTSLQGGRKPKIDFEKAKEKVKIFEKFIDGHWLYHNELFGLATNLVQADGGYQLMKDTMEKYNSLGITQYTQNNFNILPYVKKMDYPMCSIHSFSPFPEDEDLYDIISTVRDVRGHIEQIEPIEKLELGVAERKMEEDFKWIQEHGEVGKVYLLGMPTALGKTRLLSSTKATIAASTNRLKNEIGQRMKVRFVATPDTLKFESEQLNKQISNYYAIGLPQKAMQLIHHIIKTENSSKYGVADAQLARNYLTELQDARKSEDAVITSHKRAMFTDFGHDTLIYDEDPMSSLLEIKQMKISDLFALSMVCDLPELRYFIEDLEKSTPLKLMETPNYSINVDKLLETISGAENDSNVFDFFNSSYYLRDGSTDDNRDSSRKNIVHYIVKRDLPRDKKVIIMSATASIPIYQRMFGDRLVVKNIGDVQQVGTVNQYTKRSCSRQGLKQYGQRIADEVGQLPVITFKNSGQLFENPVEGICFGNCAGYDELKGQDIAVVGTPHMNPFQYFLFAKALGIDVKTKDMAMSHQKIEHNGFRFNINCFDNEELRSIQLSLIEAELLQAVGRARTLRTNATVEVYSNFPLRISDKFIY